MSVRENLELGAFRRNDRDGIKDGPRPGARALPAAAERIDQRAGTMSGGEQQMLAIGRALMARPRLLMLDEPSMGLAPVLVDLILETVVNINAAGHDDPASSSRTRWRRSRSPTTPTCWSPAASS